MILVAKRNGTYTAVDLRVLKILQVSDKLLWVYMTDSNATAIVLKQKLTEEEQRTLLEFLLRNKDKDVSYDIDELVEAVKEVKSDGQAVNTLQ
jgi:hypothetical protein